MNGNMEPLCEGCGEEVEPNDTEDPPRHINGIAWHSSCLRAAILNGKVKLREHTRSTA